MNSGHGHVNPRADGVKARCGGPPICSECALELAAKMRNEKSGDKPDDIHTMPNNGKHACSVSCFCNPTLKYQDEHTCKRVWVHKSDEELNQ